MLYFHKGNNNMSIQRNSNTRFGIFSWYQLLFFRYLPYKYGRKSWLVHFSIKILAGALFPSKKRGFGLLLEHSAPLLREKGFPVGFSKKEFPETPKRTPKKSSCQILQYKNYQPDVQTD
jgi:hypothetical protein